MLTHVKAHEPPFASLTQGAARMKFDRALIDRYREQADEPARAIAGLSPEDLNWLPPATRFELGAWSIHQLIVHLMDSHVTAAWRMRKIIAENNPLITAYDESAFVARCGYENTDTRTATEIFRIVQRMMADVLKHQPDEAFHRTGIHTERGKITLGEMVPDYIEHVEHHMKYIRAKREALGKPRPA